jgi:putative ABC transport system substrate-binding protein
MRAAEGLFGRLPGFASDVAGLNVDLIAVIGAVTVRAVRKATASIPIDFSIVVKPLGDGMARNLERSGQNVNGVTTFDPGQAKTQLEFPLALDLSLKRVAIPSNGEGRGASINRA